MEPAVTQNCVASVTNKNKILLLVSFILRLFLCTSISSVDLYQITRYSNQTFTNFVLVRPSSNNWLANQWKIVIWECCQIALINDNLFFLLLAAWHKAKRGMMIVWQNLVVLSTVQSSTDVPYGVFLSETPTDILHPWLCFYWSFPICYNSLTDVYWIKLLHTNLFCPWVYISHKNSFSLNNQHLFYETKKK